MVAEEAWAPKATVAEAGWQKALPKSKVKPFKQRIQTQRGHLGTQWKNLEVTLQLHVSDANCHWYLPATAVTKQVKGEDNKDLISSIGLLSGRSLAVFTMCWDCCSWRLVKVLQVQKLGLIVGYTIIQSLFGKDSVHRGSQRFHLLVSD